MLSFNNLLVEVLSNDMVWFRLILRKHIFWKITITGSSIRILQMDSWKITDKKHIDTRISIVDDFKFNSIFFRIH